MLSVRGSRIPFDMLDAHLDQETPGAYLLTGAGATTTVPISLPAEAPLDFRYGMTPWDIEELEPRPYDVCAREHGNCSHLVVEANYGGRLFPLAEALERFRDEASAPLSLAFVESQQGEHPFPNELWPRFEARGEQLWSVSNNGAETLLVDMTAEACVNRAPGVVRGEAARDVNESDTGLLYADVHVWDFDVNGDGLADALVSVSGGGNVCEFPGQYYVLVSLPDGRVRSSAGFGHCDIEPKLTELSAGGVRVAFRLGSVYEISPAGRVTTKVKREIRPRR